MTRQTPIESTLGFGGTALLEGDAQAAAATVSAAWDAGIRFFDVAPFYGHGLAERRLNAALGPRLEAATVCTKVGIRILPDDGAGTAHLRGRWKANDPGFSAPAYDADGIRACLGDSLARTGRRRLDIALLHGFTIFPHEAEAHLPEARTALATLRDAGTVRRIGAAVNSIETAERVLGGWSPDVLLVAGALGLAGTEPAARFLARCRRRRVSVIAAAPYAGGAIFTTGIPRLQSHCAEYGVSLAAAATQYPLRAPEVEMVVAAMNRPDRVASTLDAVAEPVPAEFWGALDAAGLGGLSR